MRTIPSSELIINDDGSIFHLHLRPEQLADKVILVGDPGRVTSISRLLDNIECDVQNREFHSVTGTYEGKRLTIVSHGIGCDNIDIVLNELDALANIDFSTRTIRPELRQLTLVRIGTSGGLQPYTPIGTFVVAEQSIGFDGVIFFYEGNNSIRDRDLESELIRQLEWKPAGLWPYVVSADASLTEQIAGSDMVRGLTIAANGFYGPQGRKLRLPLTDPELNRKIEAFEYNGRRITNFEMESSALAGLAALLGHPAVTVCCIIAGRLDKQVNVTYKDRVMELVRLVLERI